MKINRREVLKKSAIAAGYTIFFGGVATTLPACKTTPKLSWTPTFLSVEESALVGAIAERIIPKTETPGALDAGVDQYIDDTVNNMFTAEQKELFRTKIQEFNTMASEKFGKNFIKLEATQQDEVLQGLADAAAAVEFDPENPPIFSIMKDLTKHGFFTSEVGMKEFLVFDPIPGEWKGCIDYSEVNGMWAV